MDDFGDEDDTSRTLYDELGLIESRVEMMNAVAAHDQASPNSVAVWWHIRVDV